MVFFFQHNEEVLYILLENFIFEVLGVLTEINQVKYNLGGIVYHSNKALTSGRCS